VVKTMTLSITKLRGTAALLAALAAAVVMAGCVPAYPSGPVYYRGETMRPQTVELGVVESTRLVRIDSPPTGAGAVTGAVAGGALGNMAGGGAGRIAATIGGAILGGVVGDAAERDVNKRNGVEVTVRTDGGRMIAIVQEDAGEGFRPGDRVRVVSNGYATRVTR
jgi:outer membrane lipoprotein SlyB